MTRQNTDAVAKFSLDRTIVWAAVLGSLIMINIVGLAFFGRVDLTREHEFTLSPATHLALRSLKSPVTVRAYFTRDLPPPHSSQARYVKDLLESYYASAKGKIRFEFIDPTEMQTASEVDQKNQLKQDIFGNTVREPTAMERELEALGIPSVQVRVNQADKVEVKRAYMGLALSYEEKREVVPVVAETHDLEYDITSLIRKLSRDRTRKLAVVTHHEGTQADEEMGRTLGALRENYDIGEVDLNEAGTLLPDSDALLVVGPATPFNSNEIRTLDAFVHAGKGLALFLPPVKAKLQGLTSTDNDHGLDDMLKRFGVAIEPALVLDAACATISVQTQQGYMRVNQPVRYPFIAQAEHLEPSSLTRNLSQVLLPFMAPINLVGPTTGDAPSVKAEVLARSSQQSWLQQSPYNLDPMQRWTPDTSSMRPRDLIVALSGKMGRITPLSPKPAGEQNAAPSDGEPARVLVAGGDGMVLDAYLNKSNEAFLLNAMDWLVGDDGLLSVRGRGLAAAPLTEVGEARRRTVKYGNIIGLPMAFVAFGLTRWRRREAKRQTVYV